MCNVLYPLLCTIYATTHGCMHACMNGTMWGVLRVVRVMNRKKKYKHMNKLQTEMVSITGLIIDIERESASFDIFEGHIGFIVMHIH